MDHRLIRASQRLSEIPITISVEGYTIEVYWFRIMSKEGDWFIKRHTHSTYEFHFCAQGNCIVDTDSGSFPIREGMFYLSAPGCYHAQRPAREGEFIEYSLNCALSKTSFISQAAGREVERIFQIFMGSPCFPVRDRFGIIPLFNQALEEADRRLLGYEWTLHGIVPRILVAAARAIEEEQRIAGNARSPSEPSFRMTRIEEFVQSNIEKNIGPADIARFLNLSDKQIARIIMAHKGYPTKKYITRTKLRRAKELLVTGDQPIKEIARQLGFSSEYYFSSVFKLHEGMPPGVFRTSMNQGKSQPAE
ncbi:MAG: AraC family transcriptional regulator [Treponema sp.]|nr:AraC family transcriptional regulator [Treponema sp.]